MGEMTTHLAEGILDHLSNNGSFTQPGGLYLALFSGVTDGDAGTVSELSGNGYAREVISFAAPATKAMANDTAIVFTASTTDWATVTHFGVYDASTSGNLLWWGTMTNFTLEVGKTYTVGIGQVSVGLSTNFTTYLSHALLTHIDGGTAYSIPAGLYLALYSTATSDAGGGTELAAANGYSRQLVAFGAASGEQIQSSAQEQFQASGANWSNATYAAYMDASSGGNMLCHIQIPGGGWQVNDGETLTFAAGGLDISAE